jgi:16S rRNA (cytosine1402-N4)-methyltransferase
VKYHIPVMMNEVINYLNLRPGQVIIDATIGTAGHSKAILERISPAGRLIGIDRDEDSLAVSRDRLREFGDRIKLVHGNFVDIDAILKDLNIEKVGGVVFDLGISSFQLEDPNRGFSFQNEGPLDMRLDRSSYISAYDLVNNLNEEEISAILWNFGQERWHNRIAHLLIQERQRQPISTTSQLANIVLRSIPHRYRHRHYRIHPATRTFQAVRIAVNRELEILENALDKAIEILGIGAKICVISFHSLEDRAVKFTFRKAASEGRLKIITPKPLVPQEEEVKSNPSSRSSKLRVAERI